MSETVHMRPFARSGFLIAMLGGAAVGMFVARATESAIGGADPEFVSVLGAAFGGILGRSVWTRVHHARRAGPGAVGASLGLLLARVVVCVVIGMAVIGRSPVSPLGALGDGARIAVVVVGALLLVGLGAVEYRWSVRMRDHVD